MKLIDFTPDYVPAALELARACYEKECCAVSALPGGIAMPELEAFAENGMGVVALEAGRLVGYLGAYAPFDSPWGIPGVKGTFSPMQAHGTLYEDGGYLWSRLYEAAAKKWVERGVASHSIALYAHDLEAHKSFIWNGFGMRCVDAVRLLEPIALREGTGCECEELCTEDYHQILPLKAALVLYERKSPYFLWNEPVSEEDDLREADREGTRFFVAKSNGKNVAFLKLSDQGETFATEESSMKSITGAFCLPEYRGKGVYQNLLSHVITVLRTEGYKQLGVDFESYNPAGKRFWLKYFTDYTHSMVRRVDETALTDLEEIAAL